ncbi:unnamed protein product [Didymodactylos carnosus]|uniref:Cupin type-1 domain-containing protein n=1 Tax=Didymodactylos carnosus TaxID=1234261 RepID=A0A814TT94_9BILA|nr:unnamed protein product [Didymodactylos carnosus]CAF1165091.1 unnamed protein product [Didymodactylos carnosus]CAF3763167.1 unnamed protein product [Didymodactylos carnosus]CAF3928711.1 unnamed protein product [Didymodactylos carnosus]
MIMCINIATGLTCAPGYCLSKHGDCVQDGEDCFDYDGTTTASTTKTDEEPDVFDEFVGDKRRGAHRSVRRAQPTLNPKDYIFDFLNSKTGRANGTGGQAVAATSQNFPALMSNGMAMTVGYIGPCGINLPHTHPRATEMNLILEGQFQSGFYDFNTKSFVMNVVKKHMVSLFPRGVIHFEQNLGCQPATFVAVFNSDVPGVLTIADGFFGLPAEIIGASLGDLKIQSVDDLRKYLPKNPALGIESCRRRCRLP